jgi:hypothetical protein
MTGSGFSIALASGALGLALSAMPSRQSWLASPLLIVSAVVAGVFPAVTALEPLALKALGAGTIATAALVYFGQRAAPLLGLTAASLGLSLGILFRGGDTPITEIIPGMMCMLVLIPAKMLRARGMQVATYVLASWVIAAGLINLVFALLRPSGPTMDHML